MQLANAGFDPDVNFKQAKAEASGELKTFIGAERMCSARAFQNPAGSGQREDE